MTSDDIINNLDPDMIQCMVTKEWIGLNSYKKCLWYSSERHNKYLTCVRDCPVTMNNLFKSIDESHNKFENSP